jgi:hypothetical protein
MPLWVGRMGGDPAPVVAIHTTYHPAYDVQLHGFGGLDGGSDRGGGGPANWGPAMLVQPQACLVLLI